MTYLGVPAKCYDCLSEDVAVKVIDLAGCEHWFCAGCWEAETAFHDRVRQLLGEAGDALRYRVGDVIFDPAVTIARLPGAYTGAREDGWAAARDRATWENQAARVAWRAGYGQGRDDEAAALPVQDFADLIGGEL